MNRTILLTIEYDGTDFHGWQRQPSCRTVQGTLEEALSHLCGMPISIDGVSRTDAGVHALGQRATFHGDFGIPTDRIPRAMNNLLSSPGRDGDVRIVAAEEMPEGFHARYDARGKTYRYLLRNAETMPVSLRNFRYRVGKPLNLAAMRNAAAQIVGTHDFACFQAAGGTPRETTVRTIWDLTITEQNADDGRDLIIEVSGDGFLYNMVRIIAGTLVDVGLGKIPPSELSDIIASKKRERAGHTAPPQGLTLVEVYYGGENHGN